MMCQIELAEVYFWLLPISFSHINMGRTPLKTGKSGNFSYSFLKDCVPM